MIQCERGVRHGFYRFVLLFLTLTKSTHKREGGRAQRPHERAENQSTTTRITLNHHRLLHRHHCLHNNGL